MKRNVVVTGMGCVSPLGLTVAESWEALVAGRSGLGRITHFDPTPYASHVAGEVKGFDPAATGMDPKDLKRCDRFIQLGLAAVREALAQAGLVDMPLMPKAFRERVATMLGTGIGGLSSMEEAAAVLAEKGPRRISPFFIPAMLPNMLAGQVSILYGAQGPNLCPVSACATSAHALGWGKRLIEWGEADVVIAGGAEAAVCPTSVGGFAAMRALSGGFNDRPEEASRPFDEARDGFVIGEGAAVMILEEESHARARGATILGVLAGFGQSSDAYHMTTPSEGGEGAARAMVQALVDAGVAASDVGYVNAHATGTPAGDPTELQAIESVLGAGVPVSSTKGATGHLLGAAGALEAVFSLMALRTGVLPGTKNLVSPVDSKVTLLEEPRQGGRLKAVLSNSFGFGGTNAALVLKA